MALQETFGSRTYPVAYTYDAGRMKTMTTWTNFAASAGAAVTTWNYDGYRGFLANKAYADGKGPSYTYTAAGRLAAPWARMVGGQPLVTTYGYDAAGDLQTVAYSDGTTPNVTNTFDRLGRITQQSTLSSQLNSVYNVAGELVSEFCSGGPLRAFRDQRLRPISPPHQSCSQLSTLNPQLDCLRLRPRFTPVHRFRTATMIRQHTHILPIRHW